MQMMSFGRTREKGWRIKSVNGKKLWKVKFWVIEVYS